MASFLEKAADSFIAKLNKINSVPINRLYYVARCHRATRAVAIAFRVPGRRAVGSPRGPGSPRLCQMHPWQESYAILDHRAARPTLTCHLLHQAPSQTSLRKLNTGDHGCGGSHSDSPKPHGHPRDLPARSPLSARAPLGKLAVRTAIQDTIKTSR